MVRIKICGITTVEDAEKAVELRADALGFNFYQKSPRFITKVAARRIIQRIDPFMTTVGVFVNETMERIQEVIYYTGIQIIQLHGDEGPEYCSKLSRPVIKVIRVTGPESLTGLSAYPVSAFLLDSRTEGYGGSGAPFDWGLAVEAKKHGRVILSGGLTPENVRSAIERVNPYAVDVCSGVEKEPGRKDHMRMAAFIASVRSPRTPLGQR